MFSRSLAAAVWLCYTGKCQFAGLLLHSPAKKEEEKQTTNPENKMR